VKTLVAYFTWSNGNTENIARRLAKALGADLEQIRTVVPYDGSYDEVVEQGRREVNQGYEPELKPLEHDVSDYDVICVGTPTWWYTMAPAVSSYFSANDWTGKVVVPFMTNGGWPGTVIDDMESAAEGADILEPMEVQFDSQGGSHQRTPDREVSAWIDRVKAAVDKRRN
jgi:flavodoxin